MAYKESTTRAYVDKRFPRASKRERERLVVDWLTKDAAAEGIVKDFELRVGPVQKLSVLDAGSGNGGVSIAFSKHGARVHGVDIEEELVEIARAEATSEGSTAQFSWYEGETLPFLDGTFDAAVSVSVLEHVTRPVQYLSEILRVLKPNGVLYLAFPNKLYLRETHTGLWGLSYLPPLLGRIYARLLKRNPVEDNNLHFYTYWDGVRIIRASERADRAWIIRKETGRSTNPLKRLVKGAARMVGISHQALLPHVMLILEVSQKSSTP